MGIIQDRRPRDWSYRAEFNQEDLPELQAMVKHIRETHDTDMIELFNNNCERVLHGFDADYGTPIPNKVVKTEDLAVNGGLQQCINIILGTSVVRWSHMGLARGEGNITPTVSSTSLDATGGGPWYLPFATNGWSEPKGMKLFFGAIGPQEASGGLLGTSVLRDMGVFNGVGATMLNRESFYDNVISRVLTTDLQMYKTVFIFSCVIEFCPVA